VHWYAYKHGSVAGAASAKEVVAAASSTYIVVNNTYALTARIASELVIPPALLLTLGCLVVDATALGRAPLELDDEEALYQGLLLSLVLVPRTLTAAAGSILGLAGLLMQSAYTIVTLLLHRNGVLSG